MALAYLLFLFASFSNAATTPSITVDSTGKVSMAGLSIKANGQEAKISTAGFTTTGSVKFSSNVVIVGALTIEQIKTKKIEISNNGIRSFGRGKFKGSDIEIEDADRGVILTASNDTKWLVWVDNNGSLFTTQVAASPEVSMPIRRSRMEMRRKKMEKFKLKKSVSMTIAERLVRLEDMLNLK